MNDDLIRRSDAIETAYKLRRKPRDEEWEFWLTALEAIPSADRPKGKWIIPYKDSGNKRMCSNCRITQMRITQMNCNEYNFCPYCGADMRGAGR